MSDEQESVLAAVSDDLAAGQSFALATIVATRGSTYRHAGARLVVRADGSWVGNLSGGCLEGEVRDVGSRVMARGVAELVTYDLTADEEAIWGWGLGCNGAIDVLVEPPATAATALGALRAGRASGRPHVIATALDAVAGMVEVGEHLLIEEDGTVVMPAGGKDATPAASAAPTGMAAAGLVEEVAPLAARALAAGRSAVETAAVAGAPLRLFLEVLRPPLRLLVCGAGHDAVPLVRFARQLGWLPIVVDDRSAFLTAERFPEAAGFVRAEPRDAATAAGTDGRTCVVVMSHNFLRDVDYLAAFLRTGVAYLGMLGPSQRLERLLDQVRRRGVTPAPEDLAPLYSPAGLDLGADGPEEIAWAICAEILAVDRGRGAGFLRDRRGPIHERLTSAVESGQ